MSTKPLIIINFSHSHSNSKNEQQQITHINSALLPKISKAGSVKIKRKSQNQNKIMIKEVDEGDKRKKLAIVISDFMDNYTTKQKGSFLVFSQQTQKLHQRNIKIEGLSHDKFISGKSADLKNMRSPSLQELPKKNERKQHDSFIERIRNEGKVYSIKSIRSRQKIRSQPNSNRVSLSDLKGYILKAKRSSFDSKQLNSQKGKKRTKGDCPSIEGDISK